MVSARSNPGNPLALPKAMGAVDGVMSLLFLAFLGALFLLLRGRARAAALVVALMLVAVIGILVFEATTPLNLVF